jgi:hypothetical protein
MHGRLGDVRFVLTVVTMKKTVLWEAALCADTASVFRTYKQKETKLNSVA